MGYWILNVSPKIFGSRVFQSSKFWIHLPPKTSNLWVYERRPRWGVDQGQKLFRRECIESTADKHHAPAWFTHSKRVYHDQHWRQNACTTKDGPTTIVLLDGRLLSAKVWAKRNVYTHTHTHTHKLVWKSTSGSESTDWNFCCEWWKWIDNLIYFHFVSACRREGPEGTCVFGPEIIRLVDIPVLGCQKTKCWSGTKMRVQVRFAEWYRFN